MRVAHVLSSFELGGQERVALDLCRAQRAAGHVVLAVSLAPAEGGALVSAFRASGVELEHVGRRDGFDLGLVPRLARLLRQRRVDVVHTHNPRALVYGAPAGKLAGAVVIHSKHGVNPDPPRRRRLRRAAAHWVDAYVAVVESLARIAEEERECDPERLHVVANGIDLSRFAQDPVARRAIRAELGIPDSAWVIGTVGRLAPEKDHALLVRATEVLRGKDVHVVIVGDGPERARLEGARFVHLPGSKSDVPRWLAAFDVFALSSRSEGLPLALIEAMATELPVVATRVGGVADLVEDTVSGLLVPADDAVAFASALRALSDDRPRARGMGRAGRARVLEQHSAERMARQYDGLYRMCIARRRLRHARVRGGGLVT